MKTENNIVPVFFEKLNFSKIDTKSKQRELTAAFVDAVINSETNPLLVEVELAKLESLVKMLRSDERLKEYTLSKAQSYGKRELADNFNAKIEVKETGVKYDYSNSHDWQAAQEKGKQAEEVRKAIETRLKTATMNAPYIDILTGEEITGIGKSSKTTVVVTINS